ncbi:hypothetical protein [Devosia soli]|uniref:hypothetical protein n=1 Tax=Devosia soli TaxID=361041 RepID=UPI000B0428A7|nr:hypothetical protein [Devosia soli]
MAPQVALLAAAVRPSKERLRRRALHRPRMVQGQLQPHTALRQQRMAPMLWLPYRPLQTDAAGPDW